MNAEFKKKPPVEWDEILDLSHLEMRDVWLIVTDRVITCSRCRVAISRREYSKEHGCKLITKPDRGRADWPCEYCISASKIASAMGAYSKFKND